MAIGHWGERAPGSTTWALPYAGMSETATTLAAALDDFNLYELRNGPRTARVLQRPSRSVERQAAAEAISILDATPLDQLHQLHRSPIVVPLAKLELHPPIGVVCPGCLHRLGYVAVVAGTAHVRSGHDCVHGRKRIGGLWDLTHLTEPEARLHDPWVHDALAGKGNIELTGEAPGKASGYADRRRYHCPKCPGDYPVTNASLLRGILRSVLNEWPGFALGDEPDVELVRARKEAKRAATQGANRLRRN